MVWSSLSMVNDAALMIFVSLSYETLKSDRRTTTRAIKKESMKMEAKKAIEMERGGGGAEM